MVLVRVRAGFGEGFQPSFAYNPCILQSAFCIYSIITEAAVSGAGFQIPIHSSPPCISWLSLLMGASLHFFGTPLIPRSSVVRVICVCQAWLSGERDPLMPRKSCSMDVVQRGEVPTRKWGHGLGQCIRGVHPWREGLRVVACFQPPGAFASVAGKDDF